MAFILSQLPVVLGPALLTYNEVSNQRNARLWSEKKQVDYPCKTEDSRKVQLYFTTFLKELGIQNNITFLQTPAAILGQAVGSLMGNLSTTAALLIPSCALLEKDPEVMVSIIKHEIGHIVNADSLITSLIQSLAFSGASFLCALKV